ncbi:excinuclease ABC subunit UvrC [Sandaracinus amylolyticus]|uniref:UvrABC system protein C n=1 Tax=Sandaracinus amylolyticus TaxID=927083 RepID=A0A0F6W2G8_9BACT|nr:excinuclease ABC subunit UvrC [Sandaracinus amylolyticus]AKF05748.1 Excinuclease ABC subunit C [Sandaracinus amylolyticus]
MALPEIVDAKLDALPSAPGVYVFRDKKGGVLYVGKARSLRSRVRSYFQPSSSDTRFFIARLPREIGDLETFVVENEKEAALLENALIKEHKPRYNFKLRDDKDFLSLRLDTREPWPKLHVVRRPKQDGAQYFGPYDSATAARKTLRLVNRFFKLRTCKEGDFKSRVRPCLQYQIKRCPAPCVLDVNRDEYLEQARLVALFLDGRHDELVRDLEGRMRDAAGGMEYERAAAYRDQLRAVERVQDDQRIDSLEDVDQDVIGLYVQGDRAELALIMVRNGRMTNVRTFDLGSVGLPDDEILASFVSAYYAQGAHLPDEIVLPTEVEAMEGLAAVLTERRARRVRIVVPKRGAKAALLRMASENAAHAFKEKQREKEDLDARLAEVQRLLRLPKPPRRIECVDVSHTGGTDTVAAITALCDGEPDRRRYKSFHVRSVSGGDDFGAMKEVLTRRLGRAGEAAWELPDLLVVDGGKGQLGVAVAVLNELGIRDLPVCGLAKEKELGGEQRQERVYLPGQKNPIVLRERSAARWFLGLVRDEAHRVSNELRKKLGRRRRLRSGLDDVPGIGPKTRAALLKNLGSLKAVIDADETALVAAGASPKQARAIHAAFRPDLSTSVVASEGEIDRAAEELGEYPIEQESGTDADPMRVAAHETTADEAGADAEEVALSNAFEEWETEAS